MSGTVIVSRARAPQVRVEVSPHPAPPADAAVDRRWSELTIANPRHFDGPILAVKSIDLRAGTIVCRREGYKRLAVQPDARTGVDLLSVSGVITALDARGVVYVLLGRRGDQTRIYGGQWELAPSGGVDPPPRGENEVSWDGLITQLRSELLAETGLRDEITDARFIAAIRDPAAFSTDLVIQGRLTPTIDQLKPARANWEYSESLWLPLAELGGFAAREPTIPTTRATIPLLGGD